MRAVVRQIDAEESRTMISSLLMEGLSGLGSGGVGRHGDHSRTQAAHESRDELRARWIQQEGPVAAPNSQAQRTGD